MSKRDYFAYVRVSTTRQGQTGTSLSEQLSAIERYALRWNLKVVKNFEEQETAAKRGRPVFLSMLRELRKGAARGVIIHKIDRSARNLRDWAELGELIDGGVEVHFANENLDLYSRGGRLSADIQAVVAADYIRNLREEVKKGFYGRLKQGYYPMPAPVGYRDMGAAKPKEVDALKGPLVKKAFELYATEKFGLRRLAIDMKSLGLRSRSGGTISPNGIGSILRNPFYIGVIKLKSSDQVFRGRHEPLIDQGLFDTVQLILQGKSPVGSGSVSKHSFLFRRMVSCSLCGYRLIAELQKYHVYYRCHTRGCEQKTIREEILDKSVAAMLKRIHFQPFELEEFRTWVEQKSRRTAGDLAAEKRSVELRIEQANARLSRLVDAFVAGMIDETDFRERKNDFVITITRLKNQLESDPKTHEVLRKTEQFLERLKTVYLSYLSAPHKLKREMLQSVVSNIVVEGKTVTIKPNLPFELIINRGVVTNGGAYRHTPRTFLTLLGEVFDFFKDGTLPKNYTPEVAPIGHICRYSWCCKHPSHGLSLPL